MTPDVLDGKVHWVIEATIKREGRGWNENVSADILANSAERALSVYLAAYPGARVHVVRRVGSGRPILIDLEA